MPTSRPLLQFPILQIWSQCTTTQLGCTAQVTKISVTPSTRPSAPIRKLSVPAVSLPLPNRLHCHKHLFLRTRKAGKGEEWKNSGMKDPVTQPTRQALTMHRARPQQHGGRPDGLRPLTAPSLPPPARPSSFPQ